MRQFARHEKIEPHLTSNRQTNWPFDYFVVSLSKSKLYINKLVIESVRASQNVMFSLLLTLLKNFFANVYMSLPKLTPENIIKSIYSSPLNVHRNNLGLVLDLSYVTNQLIVCSYPVMKYPKLFYRNNLKDLVTFLNAHHGPGNWKIYNFKVETGDSDYTDEDLLSLVNHQKYNTSTHPSAVRYRRLTSIDVLSKECLKAGIEQSASAEKYEVASDLSNIGDILERTGWKDHAPPPFTLLEELIDEIHQYLTQDEHKVAVLHCKMGKGRSGTVIVAYLMKFMQCPMKESCEIFMNTRFKPGISKGITILSQLRYLRYHEIYLYLERENQRQQLLQELRTCKFRITGVELMNPIGVLAKGLSKNSYMLSVKIQNYNKARDSLDDIFVTNCEEDNLFATNTVDKLVIDADLDIDQSDIRITFGLRSKSAEFINNFTMLTSISHCWINLYWETLTCSKSDSPTNFRIEELLEEQKRYANKCMGTFSIKWDELDGIKGTKNKGLKLFDTLTLKWMVA